jgi:ribonuclease HI
VGGKEIDLVDSTVYLGITLDSLLSFRPHIEAKMKQAKGKLRTYNDNLAGRFGPRLGLARSVFTGVIRPALTYACHVWGHKVLKKDILVLNKINRMAAATVCSFKYGTPSASLEVALRLQPLDLHLSEEALMKVSNMPRVRTWDGLSSKLKPSGHLKLCDKTLETLGAHLGKSYASRNTTTLDIVLGDGVEEHRDDNVVKIFTDGSKTKYGVGSGIVVKDMEEFSRYRCKLPDYCSVYQAEMQALKEAAQFCSGMTDRTIVVHCDSQAALQSLNSSKFGSELADSTASLWQAVSDRCEVKLVWVRAHVGTEGNEEADRLAKEGTTYQVEVYLPPSRKHIQGLIGRHYSNKWEIRWIKLPGHLASKFWMPSTINKRLSGIFLLTQYEITILIAFITGFNNLRVHAAKIDPNILKLCRKCNEEDETAIHLATDCGPLLNISRATLGDVASGDWDLGGLMKFLLIELRR